MMTAVAINQFLRKNNQLRSSDDSQNKNQTQIYCCTYFHFEMFLYTFSIVNIIVAYNSSAYTASYMLCNNAMFLKLFRCDTFKKYLLCLRQTGEDYTLKRLLTVLQGVDTCVQLETFLFMNDFCAIFMFSLQKHLSLKQDF